MATNTTLQYLETTGENALGASVDLATASNRRQIETFLSGGTIPALSPVKFDTSATGSARAVTVVKTGSDGDPGIGIALKAASSGDKVEVVVAGYVENALSSGTINAGEYVQCADGKVKAATAGTHDLFGVALEAAASSTVDMYVFKRF